MTFRQLTALRADSAWEVGFPSSTCRFARKRGPPNTKESTPRVPMTYSVANLRTTAAPTPFGFYVVRGVFGGYYPPGLPARSSRRYASNLMHENRETSEVSVPRRTDGQRLRPYGPCVRLRGVGQWHSTYETSEQPRAIVGGGWGGKAADQGEHSPVQHAPDTERDARVPRADRCAARLLVLPFLRDKSRMR